MHICSEFIYCPVGEAMLMTFEMPDRRSETSEKNHDPGQHQRDIKNRMKSSVLYPYFSFFVLLEKIDEYRFLSF